MTEPTELTERELQRAFSIWHYEYSAKETDAMLAPFLDPRLTPQTDWLRSIRKGLFLSASTVASRLKISRPAYSRYEKNEEVLSLATLKRAADAMDCELIYAIRPKQQKACAQMIWEIVRTAALQHPSLRTCWKYRRGEALAAIALRHTRDAKFRKGKEWTQNQDTD